MPRNDAFPQCNGQALFFSEWVEAYDSLDFLFLLLTSSSNSKVFVRASPLYQDKRKENYYPFGGLVKDFTYSSNGYVENKLRYNSKELMGEFNLGWYDYGSRYYNPGLGIFMAVDPQAFRGYGIYPYAYCANNPVLYVDPNGEWFGLDDLFAMAIGGIVNVVSHAISGDIENVGHAFALFGIGAAAGEATLYAGPLAGGAVLGAGNSIINQGFKNGWGNIDFSQVLMGTAMGMGTAWLGGQISTMMAPVTSSLFANVSSPVLQQTLTNTVTNSVSGFALSTGVSLMGGASIGDALKDGGWGALSGGALGMITGFAGGLKYSYERGISPWTGESTSTGLMTPSKFAASVSSDESSSILQRKYGDPVYSTSDKTVYFNQQTGRSFVIHTDPIHGAPHLDITTRGWPITLNSRNQPWSHQKFYFK